jgi:hypothetical protein
MCSLICCIGAQSTPPWGSSCLHVSRAQSAASVQLPCPSTPLISGRSCHTVIKRGMSQPSLPGGLALLSLPQSLRSPGNPRPVCMSGPCASSQRACVGSASCRMQQEDSDRKAKGKRCQPGIRAAAAADQSGFRCFRAAYVRTPSMQLALSGETMPEPPWRPAERHPF